MYIHSDIPSGILSSIYSCTFSGKTCWVSRFHQSCPLLLFTPGILWIFSDILSGICIWHIF